MQSSVRRLAALVAAATLAGCASNGAAVRVAQSPPPPAVASDPAAQAALERACYGCHASGYGLAGRDRLAFSYWFRGSAQSKLDFTHWNTLDDAGRTNALKAIAQTVRDGDMPPWDSRFVDGRAKLSPTERDALGKLGS